ncbi:MAG: glycosyltransferase family 2 protein [Alphaproteobacteria bacterium]|nr:glycosyltransferase family 2 protein [Alphaproteobacteria bacterium]
MMTHPSVTIGIPVYNGEACLDKMLASICAQSFQDMEILVSDNASTDSTPEIIARWAAKDKRIRVHRQPENVGARNNFIWLLENAAAPWMKFAAHDDMLTTGYVEALYGLAKAHPEARLIAASVQLIKPDGARYKNTPFPVEINEARGFVRTKLLLKEVRSGWFYGLFRRGALKEAWYAAERFKYVWGQDLLVLLPFLLSGAVVGTPDATFYQLDTGVSAARYKPKALPEQAHMYFSYLYACFRALWLSPLTLAQKTALVPQMIIYTGYNCWKLRRLVLFTLRAPFMPIKRFFAPPRKNKIIKNYSQSLRLSVEWLFTPPTLTAMATIWKAQA